MKKVKILAICIAILIACWVFGQPPIQPIVNFFLDLDDTPSTYSGQDGKYLKVDETNGQLVFDSPAGSGDMTKAVYDTDEDNIVDLAEDLSISSQAAGDVLYYDGSNWIRLAKGTAGQVLKMNDGATAPEWDTDNSTVVLIVAADDSSTKGKATADYLCDGTADDVQINSALTALSGSGGTVKLLEGTYDITAKLEIYDNSTLTGQGHGTILNMDTVMDIGIGNQDTSKGNTNILIEKMYLDGKDKTNDPIELTKATHCTIRDIEATQGKDDGIELADCNNCLITNCICHDADQYHGVELDGASCDNVIANNIIYSCTGKQIYLDSTSHDNLIIGNVVRDGSDYGIGCGSSTQDNTIIANRTSGNNNGHFSDTGTGNLILNNDDNGYVVCSRVGNDSDGKRFTVKRSAAEGDDYFTFYVNSNQLSYLRSTKGISIIADSGNVKFDCTKVTHQNGTFDFDNDNFTTTGYGQAASIILTGADANPDASGELQYDNIITGMSGGGLRWYDNDSVRLIVDLETDPSNDDYVVAYDADADGFYMKADAGAGAAGTMTTVEDGDVQVGGSDIVTLDFDGTVFAITEDPDTEINIDIADDGLDSQHYNADSIDNEHINWADIDYLTDEGAGINETYGAGWNADIGPPEKDDVYDYLHNFDADDDGSFTDETWYTNILDGTATFTDLNGNDIIDSDNYNADSIDDEHINWGSGAGQIDLADIPGGTAGASSFDFGGATSVEIPNGANPTTDAAGEITIDTDDEGIEFYGSASRYLPAIKIAQATIFNPDNIQSTEDAIPLLFVADDWAPHGITIKDIHLAADQNNSASITLEEWTSPTTHGSDIETVSFSSATTAEDDGTLADASIATNAWIFVDLDDTDLNFLQIVFTYYVNPGD